MNAVEQKYAAISAIHNYQLTEVQYEEKATDKLENSFAGMWGKV